MIEINYTLIIQVINFFVLLWILNRILYKPILKILEERGRKTAGAMKDAEEMESDAAEMLQNYERGLREAKVKAHEERDRIRIQGIEREREILDEARKNALESINKFRSKIEDESKEALDSLTKESQDLSSEIVEKILAREVR
jgi:F-type H+-transporting ATPase subunit b